MLLLKLYENICDEMLFESQISELDLKVKMEIKYKKNHEFYSKLRINVAYIYINVLCIQ